MESRRLFDFLELNLAIRLKFYKRFQNDSAFPIEFDLSTELFVKNYKIPQLFMMIHNVSSALSFCHEQGIIHNDICIDNILIKEDNFLLCDFGQSIR
eukprot:Awhi_evm1s10702